MREQQRCSGPRIPAFSTIGAGAPPLSERPWRGDPWGREGAAGGGAWSVLLGLVRQGWLAMVVFCRRWQQRRTEARAAWERRLWQGWQRFERTAVPSSPLWLVGGIIVSLGIALAASRLQPDPNPPASFAGAEYGWWCEGRAPRSFSSSQDLPARPPRCV